MFQLRQIWPVKLDVAGMAPETVEREKLADELIEDAEDAYDEIVKKYANTRYLDRIAQRQFNELLKRCDLKANPLFEYSHSLYSLRHTEICMRLTLSKDQVNIYTLAKNAARA